MIIVRISEALKVPKQKKSDDPKKEAAVYSTKYLEMKKQ